MRFVAAGADLGLLGFENSFLQTLSIVTAALSAILLQQGLGVRRAISLLRTRAWGWK